ncbi:MULTISPECIES: TolC family protein [Leptospira]|nr:MULTISPECIES: TolC family protein [Leptospira]ALO27495.1 outer membrane efflux protein [Leptospira borgpetersenii serovar Ballum]ANH01810.1 Outer membrane efflux protein [Leptospira borgpetersenii str. 4E]AXX15036.1 TolC family protein [Leptospira borgpetersenii serovar Ceylonica]EKP14413.1 outer membrane efflux protein [Leptospira borgpetersenii str. 200801926]EKQ92766.1 outer membrane efflux protein [Leptospira borgpetersenii str. UI 09149]
MYGSTKCFFFIHIIQFIIIFFFSFEILSKNDGDSLAFFEEYLSKEKFDSPKRIKIDLKKAEETFLRNNLSLLAKRLEIEASKAEIIQTHLWDNPILSIDQNIYNQNTNRYLDTTRNGQTTIQIEQIFVLAGKRDKRIRIAQWNTNTKEQDFYDLLRALKLELRVTFYKLSFLKKSLEFFDENINSIRKTIKSSEAVYKNRDILLSEVLRLKSILFRLETDRSEIVSDIIEKENILKLLLNEPNYSEAILEIETTDLDEKRNSILAKSDQELLSIAFEKRPDLKALEFGIKAEQTNLALQRSLAIPDLTLGGSWDRAGNYINNYYGFTVSISIPTFDRNQGNIRESELILASKKAKYEEKKIKIKAEVLSAVGKAKEKERLLLEYKNSFTKDYQNLASLMVENYRKKYLTILEFSDFFEAYSDSFLKMLRLQSDRIGSLESVNYTLGSTVLEIGR